MIRHITAEDIFRLAIRTIEMGTNEQLFEFFGTLLRLDVKVRNCYDAYTDMKRRKNDSRTYFLNKMRERLNLRMQRDDEKERERHR